MTPAAERNATPRPDHAVQHEAVSEIGVVRRRGRALRDLVQQTSQYAAGSVLVIAAGLISFPFLTRIFSVADYGTMNLIGVTLALLAGVGKLGIQHAILRYHSEVDTGRLSVDRRTFDSTALIGVGGASLAVALVWGVISQTFPASWLNDDRLPGLFALTAILVFARAVHGCVTNQLRAEQRSGMLVQFQIASKYVGLALTVASLLLIARSLWVFYGAIIVAELGSVVVLLVILMGRSGRAWPSVRAFSPSLYGTLLRFGLPMMIGYELSGIILVVGDRYIIHILMPGDPLGVYSAAYNLCQYVQMALGAAVEQAIVPIYMRLWSEGSEEEFRAFIDKALRWYVMLGIPIVAGMAAVGPQLLPFLASEKYLTGAGIIPYVMAGMMLDGTTAMVGAGLFIQKQSRLIARLVLFSAVLNVLLNVVLIPSVGLYGAAIATLVSYLALASAMAFAGRRRLRVTVPWDALAKAAGLALAMYAVVTMVNLETRVATIVVKLVLGVALYTAGMVALDRDARAALRMVLARVAGKTPAAGDMT